MRVGIESEYLLGQGWDIERVMTLEVPGVKREFLRFMVECVSDALSPHEAVAQIRRMREELHRRGVHMMSRASLPNRRVLTAQDVTGSGEYYDWVFTKACEMLGCKPFDLHHVGIHLNLSERGMSEDQAVHCANWMRCLMPLFILLTSNSALFEGERLVAHSGRMLGYPNRWDVPFWASASDFSQWLAEQISQERIYPGQDRCWMTAIPRMNGQHEPYVEVRGLDGGVGVPDDIVLGCCLLAQRIIEHALEYKHLPVSDPSVLQSNDQGVATLGIDAIMMFRGEHIPIRRVAELWCAGIEPLVRKLENSSE